jgi:hypothetical protein
MLNAVLRPWVFDRTKVFFEGKNCGINHGKTYLKARIVLDSTPSGISIQPFSFNCEKTYAFALSAARSALTHDAGLDSTLLVCRCKTGQQRLERFTIETRQ